jgi:trans-2-enoyl-CoA reductase
MAAERIFYSRLGVAANATPEEIRAAFRKLVLTAHPDRGGREEDFTALQAAYEVLSDPRRRRIYDRHGEHGLEQSAEALFVGEFRGGEFQAKRDDDEKNLKTEVTQLRRENESLQRQLMIVKPETANSYATSFESWLRNRNPGEAQFLNSSMLAEKFGVDESSYEPVELPDLKTIAAEFHEIGEFPQAVRATTLPPLKRLQWGEVLVHMLAAPVTALDKYLARWYMIHGEEMPKLPAVAGSQGVGMVVRVGPGVEALNLRDLVLPGTPLVGTWRRLGVFNHRKLYRLPATNASAEGLANFWAYCTAYRLLEDYGSLRPGDTIIQSDAETAVGQALMQLCRVLQIKTINLVDAREDFDTIADLLHGQGGTYVWKNEGAVNERLRRSGVPMPRLGISMQGGPTIHRIADCLRPGAALVLCAPITGKIEPFPYVPLLYQKLQIHGFWLYQWLKDNPNGFEELSARVLPLLEEGRLKVESTHWEQLEDCLEKAIHDRRLNPMLQFGTVEEANALATELNPAPDPSVN